MVTLSLNGHIIKHIDLLVFDKDGTLIDLYVYWSNMIKLRAEGICSYYKLDSSKHEEKLMFEMGVDIHRKELRPDGPVGLLPRAVVQKAAEKYLERLDCPDVNRICFRIFKEVDEKSLSLLDRFIKPLKGAIELLRLIKSRDCKIAIATTDKTERAKLAMRFLGIEDLIDLVVGADKVKNSKPAPDILDIIVKDLDIEPLNSVMVGDAKTDIQMGISAGFKASIAVCSGLTKRDLLHKLTPYVLKNISKIHID